MGASRSWAGTVGMHEADMTDGGERRLAGDESPRIRTTDYINAFYVGERPLASSAGEPRNKGEDGAGACRACAPDAPHAVRAGDPRVVPAGRRNCRTDGERRNVSMQSRPDALHGRQPETVATHELFHAAIRGRHGTRPAPATCRSPATPRNCQVTSHTWAMAWAGTASPKEASPPLVFTGMRPPGPVGPCRSSFAASPSPYSPRSSYHWRGRIPGVPSPRPPPGPPRRAP